MTPPKCPVCGSTTQLMAGVNVPSGDVKKYYWACWTDNAFNDGTSWIRITRKPKAEWRICSPYHKQATVAGEIIDWWPSKNKYRFRGQTHRGDPNKVMRKLMGAPA